MPPQLFTYHTTITGHEHLYDFGELYLEMEDEGEKGIKGTKLKYKKLNSLDVGDFVWNVTAFSYQRDGFEERRSLTASQEFRIDISSPVQIKTENTGRMYSAE